MAPMRFVDLPVDPRDVGPDRDRDTILGAHGGALIGAAGFHIPGITRRADVYRALHDQIVDMAIRDPDPEGRRLCGAEHVEDIEVWQTPHSARDALRRIAAQLTRTHRRPVVLVHGWQHIGPCPDPETGARP